MTLTLNQVAWDILQEVEATDFFISLARERATSGGFHSPKTPGEFLFWFESQAYTYPDEAPGRLERAALFREAADRLRDLGFEPVVPQQELPENRQQFPQMKQAVFEGFLPGG
jgi:hypothetical protein